MKFSPPGAEPYRKIKRIDGFIGSDPSAMPLSVARISSIVSPLHKPTEVDRIRARMMARQMAYERKNRVRNAWRRKFGLIMR